MIPRRSSSSFMQSSQHVSEAAVGYLCARKYSTDGLAQPSCLGGQAGHAAHKRYKPCVATRKNRKPTLPCSQLSENLGKPKDTLSDLRVCSCFLTPGRASRTHGGRSRPYPRQCVALFWQHRTRFWYLELPSSSFHSKQHVFHRPEPSRTCKLGSTDRPETSRTIAYSDAKRPGHQTQLIRFPTIPTTYLLSWNVSTQHVRKQIGGLRSWGSSRCSPGHSGHRNPSQHGWP